MQAWPNAFLTLHQSPKKPWEGNAFPRQDRMYSGYKPITFCKLRNTDPSDFNFGQELSTPTWQGGIIELYSMQETNLDFSKSRFAGIYGAHHL